MSKGAETEWSESETRAWRRRLHHLVNCGPCAAGAGVDCDEGRLLKLALRTARRRADRAFRLGLGHELPRARFWTLR